MSQFKIYGQRHVLAPLRAGPSEVLHATATDVLGLPPDERFHRFFPHGPRGLPHPHRRTERYTVIEVLVSQGRTTATKKAFHQPMHRDSAADLQIDAVDLGVAVIETPRHDWAIRGRAGDELTLTYAVEQ